MILRIKQLPNFIDFKPPAHYGDAGYDVYATKSVTLVPLERFAMPLGIAIEFPASHVALVQQKSGNSIHYGFTTVGNVIDSSYRGEVHAILVNISNSNIDIVAGMAVAQLIFVKIASPIPFVVNTLGTTLRGKNGLGSGTRSKE